MDRLTTVKDGNECDFQNTPHGHANHSRRLASGPRNGRLGVPWSEIRGLDAGVAGVGGRGVGRAMAAAALGPEDHGHRGGGLRGGRRVRGCRVHPSAGSTGSHARSCTGGMPVSPIGGARSCPAPPIAGRTQLWECSAGVAAVCGRVSETVDRTTCRPRAKPVGACRVRTSLPHPRERVVWECPGVPAPAVMTTRVGGQKPPKRGPFSSLPVHLAEEALG